MGASYREAAQRWNGEGSLLFTSSSALYDVSDNGICDEVNAFSYREGFLQIHEVVWGRRSNFLAPPSSPWKAAVRQKKLGF